MIVNNTVTAIVFVLLGTIDEDAGAARLKRKRSGVKNTNKRSQAGRFTSNEPVLPVLEPALPVLEPVLPELEPVLLALEPVMPALEPMSSNDSVHESGIDADDEHVNEEDDDSDCQFVSFGAKGAKRAKR